jgi:murein DD-endopeptidase MepM/ murein hydrolase activator NlpD
MIQSARVRVLLVGVAAIASITVVACLVWVLQKRSGYYTQEKRAVPVATPQVSNSLPQVPSEVVSATPASTPVTAPPPPPPELSEVAANATPYPTPPDAAGSLSLDPSYVGRLNLMIPVAGVKPQQLLDTFKDARSEERVHDAIDIPAAAGTSVLAAADGEIVKLFQSERGGTTIYQLSMDKKLIFYYAHLQGYADGLIVGKVVRQGEVIAYVGDTGNAGAGNYHLHFSVAIVRDPKRYWEGVNLNPYPLLHK